MKIKFITNACCLYESKGFTLLSDPWLTEGAFEGSWFHWPPLQPDAIDIENIQALYISHLHPDHYDRKALGSFPKNIPVVVLDKEPNYLSKFLKHDGFESLVPIKSGEQKELGPFKITLFEPFAAHPFSYSEIGNIIDSAMLIADEENYILNANDNALTVETAGQFSGRVDIAQLNYNAAGPYPSCFDNYSYETKKLAHELVIHRNVQHMARLCKIIQPKFLMPFAGAFVIGGKNYGNTVCMGATTEADVARRLKEILPAQEIFLGEAKPTSLEDMIEYAESLKDEKYPYELEKEASLTEIHKLLPEARKHLWVFQQRFQSFPKCHVYIELEDSYFGFALHKEGTQVVDKKKPLEMPLLILRMDLRLLHQCLVKNAHWNNVEVGQHIRYTRIPDLHQPDVHTLLSFFHV